MANIYLNMFRAFLEIRQNLRNLAQRLTSLDEFTAIRSFAMNAALVRKWFLSNVFREEIHFLRSCACILFALLSSTRKTDAKDYARTGSLGQKFTPVKSTLSNERTRQTF